MSDFAIWNRPVVCVYDRPSVVEYNEKGQLLSTVSDEGLYGAISKILKKEGSWTYIISSYGYAGYVKEEDYIEVDEKGKEAWQKGLMVTNAGSTDVLTASTVHGARMLTLPRGSQLQYLSSEEDGWIKVCLADGTEGFVPERYLSVKRFDERLLEMDTERFIEHQKNAVKRRQEEIGGADWFCFQELLDQYYQGSEEKFREELVKTAKSYVGTQYRWGGRSSFGIDCSGMAGISYLLCGIIIYRDASIVRDYPMKRLNLKWTDGQFDLENLDSGALKPGDALYFPGHVAMYLGDGIYLHSTAKAGSNGVVYNSLRPEHELFREDLLKSLYACAGIR